MTLPEQAAASTGSQTEWQDGWYRPARALPSPNFGPRPGGACIDLLVLHSISLPPGEFDNGYVQQLFTNQLDWDAHPYFQGLRGLQVSSHFFITRAGELWQFVGCDDRAWHAGASAYRGRSQCNDDSIGVELEGLEGCTFEARQYDALARLGAALLKAYPIVHIAGHEHIAPGRKLDPGPGFDWHQLRTLLKLPETFFPAPGLINKP